MIPASLSNLVRRAGCGSERAENGFVIVLLIAQTALIFLQVILRFFNLQAPAGIEELARICMLWVILVGAVIATREGTHIQSDILTFIHSTRIIKLVGVANNVSCLVISCVFVSWCYDFWLWGILEGKRTLIMQLPSYVVDSSFFVGSVLMSLYFLVSLVRSVYALRHNSSIGGPIK